MIINDVKYMVKNIKDYIKYLKYKNTLPKNPMHDDIYIVEFPKSGITWLSFLISNINSLINQRSDFTTPFNVHQKIYDVHHGRILINRRPNELTFIKSHSAYNPFYNNVILLIRNPFSVMESYYHYLMRQNVFQGSLKSFITSKYGIDSWIEWMDSWHNNCKISQRIIVVKYEDLKNDTLLTMRQLYKQLGFNVNDIVLNKAISLSSFENMKKLESEYKKLHLCFGIDFVRKGNLYSNDLDSEDKKLIYNKSKKYLKQYYSDMIKGY